MQVAERMQRNVVTVGPEDSLAVCVQVMGWSSIRHLPVLEDGKLVGMLRERDVITRTDGDLKRPVDGVAGDAMRTVSRVVPPTMSLEEAAAILVADEIDALPVVALGDLVGILTSTDILGYVARCALPEPRSETPTLEDVMVRRVEAAFPDDLLADAANRMTQHRIRHLPVVDASLRLVGILSDRDVRTATGSALLDLASTERWEHADRLLVGDVMTEAPLSALPSEPVSSAIQSMVEGGVGALPVVDEDQRLIGIVSYVDMLSYLGARALRP